MENPDEINLDPAQLRAKGDDVNLTPRSDEESITALDAMAEEATKENTPSAEEKPPTEEKPKEGAAPSTEEKPKEGEAKPTEEKPKETAPKDGLDDVKLPPTAKQKSVEAFEKVKSVAREQIAAKDAELQKVSARVQELEQKVAEADKKPAITPEVQAELEDLRKFKLAHEVESDPTFREFDGKIKSNTDSIYKKLEGVLSKENIEAIKQIGGPDQVDWEPILPKLPIALRRYIESKLVENETLRDNREQALAKAKDNAQVFLRDRTEREVKEVTSTAEGFLKNLPWSAEKPIPANAKPEEREQLEAHNKFAREMQGLLKDMLKDRSASRHAELAVGTLIAYHNKAQLDATAQQLQKVTEENKAKVEDLTKKLDAATKELNALKGAEVPRSRGEGRPAAKPKGADMNVSGAEALDALAKQLAEEQE